MVSPKSKAIALTNRKEIKEAYLEIGRLTPNKDKVLLLINTFNEVSGAELLTWSSYARCGDCQRALRNFWRYVIEQWQKTS